MRYLRKITTIAVSVIALLYVLFYFLIIRNPLPRDEKIIEVFEKNRKELEILIDRFQNYGDGEKIDSSTWFKVGDTENLMKYAGVDSVDYSVTSPWLSNPYSTDTAKIIKNEVVEKENNTIFRKYGGLMVRLSPRGKYHKLHLRYNDIWKELYFIPEVPRIENGEILWPFNTKGEYSSRAFILSSLNYFPKNWKIYDCLYRRIDIHWFIRMCNGR